MSNETEQQESPPKEKENALVVVNSARLYFEKRQEQIAKWARNGVDPRAIVRFTLQEMSQSWKLRDCTPSSVYLAILACGVTGLEPGALKQEAFIIPYYNSKLGRHEAKFQSGWRGIQKQALRTGVVKMITANTVYSNDLFELDEGTANSLVHKRARGARGEVIGAYAWAQLAGGFHQIKFMPIDELQAVQRFAEKRGQSPAWREWPDEMRNKTALRRLGKYLPMGDDYFAGVRIEDAQESDEDGISDAEVINMFTDGDAMRDTAPELAAAAAFTGAPAPAQTQQSTGKTAAPRASGSSKAKPIDAQSTERPTTGSSAQQTSSSGATGPASSAAAPAASPSSSPAAAPSSAPAAAASAAASPTSTGPAASAATPAASSSAASSTPSTSAASAPAPSQASSASAPAAQSQDNSFNPFGDDPEDAAPAPAEQMSVESFEAWLTGCKTQRDILERKGEWVRWAADNVTRHSPESIRMQDALAKRWAAVPE